MNRLYQCPYCRATRCNMEEGCLGCEQFYDRTFNIMPRISHFIDENGNNVDVNAGGVNVKLNQDGTHKYFRSYGFAGRIELTPVYEF